MRVGTVEVGPGERGFGRIEGPPTHGRFITHVPLHVVRGASDGPVLLVQAGLSGLEIEPAMVLPHLVKELDPARMRGSLILVPLLNTSGFEFEQITAIWDDKHLNRLGRGRADGSVSEQLLDVYYREAVSKADALIDIRTGAQWGYYRYAGVYRSDNSASAVALALALGLPHVLLGQPDDQSLAYEAACDGKQVVSAWIGGGPGLRDYRDDDLERVRRAVLNAMRHLKIIEGELDQAEGPATLVEGHTVLFNRGERGLVFMDASKRGTLVRAGEELGIVRHPFTGAVIERITAERDGVMLHAGGVWPVLPEDTPLAMLGDVIAAA